MQIKKKKPEMLPVSPELLQLFLHCDIDSTRRYLLIQQTDKGQLASRPFYPSAMKDNRARMIPDGPPESVGNIVATSVFRREDLTITLGFMCGDPRNIRIGLAEGLLLIECVRTSVGVPVQDSTVVTPVNTSTFLTVNRN